jgi:Asp-tRNA(Asn)/Glu-tRNA(Gln) amidotransferase A subunit family amidase
MTPLAPHFDAVGWLARDAQTLALAAQASLPPGGGAGSADDSYALCPALLETLQPEVRAAFTGWIRTAAMPTPKLVDLPDPTETFRAFRIAQGAEAWQSHGTSIREHPDALGPDVAARFAWASTITADEAAAARTVLAQARAQIDAALGDSILLSPTTPTPAPPLSADAAALDAARAATITLTCLAPVTGRPALSVPLLHADGVPVGLSLLGPRDADLDLVARASALADTDTEADADPR